MSLVTIIVPIYNSEKTLVRCVDSLINQSLQDIEIILINDGSSDDSYNIIENYARLDNRIKIIDQNNKGLSFVRNRGIEDAKGKYILHIDSDDWIESDMCKIMYTESEKYNADIVTSSVFFDYPNRSVIKKEPYCKICDFNKFLELFATKRGLNSVCNKLIKRSLYVSNNIRHYEDITLGEDSSTLLRLIVFAKNIVTIDRAFYHYIRSDDSMSGIKNIKVIEYVRAIEKVENFYRENDLNTEIFPVLRYKIGYKLLYLYLFRKKKKEIYKDFVESYRLFFNEIIDIVHNRYFLKLPILDKLFIFSQFMMKRLNILKIKKSSI
jgi:glycosyltransferase involved in cell wall biosynthesis